MDTFLVHLAAHLLGSSTLRQAASNGQPFQVSWRSPLLTTNATVTTQQQHNSTSRTTDKESWLTSTNGHRLVLVDLCFDFHADGSISLRIQSLWKQRITDKENNSDHHYQYCIGNPMDQETLERHFEWLQIDVHHTPAPLLAKSMAEAWQRLGLSKDAEDDAPKSCSQSTTTRKSIWVLPLEYHIRGSVLMAAITLCKEEGMRKKLDIPAEFVHVTCQHLDPVVTTDTTTNQSLLETDLSDLFQYITTTWRTSVRTSMVEEAKSSMAVAGGIPDRSDGMKASKSVGMATSIPDSSSSLANAEWKEVRVARRGKGASFGRKRKL